MNFGNLCTCGDCAQCVEVEEEEVLEVEEDEHEGEVEDTEEAMSHMMSNSVFGGFEAHVRALERARDLRRDALRFKSVVEEGVGEDGTTQSQDALDSLGVWKEGDELQGDVNMRTLNTLLARVDARGFERCAALWNPPEACRDAARAGRSAQQLEFHVAFAKAAARVIYRKDWETQRPNILKKHGWTKASSEVLISTPRRFGKTYRCAFAALPQNHGSFAARAQHCDLLRVSGDGLW